jgi:hypothetical protein
MYGRGLAPAALGPAAGSGGHLRRILGVYGHTPAARPVPEFGGCAPEFVNFLGSFSTPLSGENCSPSFYSDRRVSSHRALIDSTSRYSE